MNQAIQVDLAEKFALLNAYYTPKQVASINDTAFKIAKFKGPFTWHKHAEADEMFLVFKGELAVDFRAGKTLQAGEGQFILIPRGLEHRPNPPAEVWVVILEPEGVLNTGDVVNEFTVANVECI